MKFKIYSLFIFLALNYFSLNIQAAPLSPSQEEMLKTLPPDQRDAIQSKMLDAESLREELEETFDEKRQNLAERPKADLTEVCEDCIFGYEYFQFSPTTFAPVDGTPVTSDYILGPGDKLILNYLGNNEDKQESYITREGNFYLPKIGPVFLNGMSLEKASEIIKTQVQSKLIGTDAVITLKEIRSISVFVLGEAYKPGVYTLSGLSKVTNALYVSGGVNKKGSLRNIQIIRENEILDTYDFYELLLKGKVTSDLKLQDGDRILIPFFENTVKVGGSFKRPHTFEFLEGETIKDAVNFAGGFLSDVNPNANLELTTIDSNFVRQIQYIQPNAKSLSRELANGDMLNASSISGILSRSITLSGEVKFPGEYSITKGDTLLDILNRAGGYTEDAFSEGAVFLRETVAKSQETSFSRSADELEKTMVDIISKGSIPQITEFTLRPIFALIERLRSEVPVGRMVLDADILKLKTDPLSNLKLEDGDYLHIPKRPNDISVSGEVLYNSTVTYSPNSSVDDYIAMSGGLSDSADKGKIFIILPNGQSSPVKRTLFASTNSILPGSTIVVPRDTRPLDAINLTQIITPVLADLATSAAAIAALND
jgi:protein involved in polysaccharide export with SLBB domain